MKKYILLSFPLGIFLSFIIPIFTTPSALALTTCTYTKLGNPAGEPVYPPECQGGGAGAMKAVDLARQQIGKTYVFGGPQPRNWAHWNLNQGLVPDNFDCSSLVGWAWYWATDGKVNLPVTTKSTWGQMPADKFQVFTPAQKAQIQPGDLIYWSTEGNIHHTAIFSGPCQNPANGASCIIEAQQTGVPLKESGFDKRTSGSWVGFIRPVNY